VLVGRDAQGLYAMSLQCTHQFCAVNLVGTELDCPCHHSRFDINGNVIQGPAITQLPHFALTIDSSGNVSINRYATVSGSTRVPV
jgi:Rieske Fe-S protein